MEVSVILCTYSFNRINNTICAIDSILGQTYPNIELVVSVDHNKELLKYLEELYPDNVVFAYNDLTIGLSDTRNAGIKKAKGDVLAFVDDDAIADKNWLELLVSNYSNSNVLGVGGILIPLWEKKRPWWFPKELDWIIGCTYEGHTIAKTAVRNLIGCNMSFKKTAIEQVGYFNPHIGRLNNIPFSGEEMELCIRLRNHFPNGMIIFDPEVIVYHKIEEQRMTLKYILNRSFREGFSKALICKLFDENILSAENNYLRFLLFSSIPKFLFKNPFKALVIISTISMTSFGYFYGVSKNYKTRL